jgi:two-component sensor histidine kinase
MLEVVGGVGKGREKSPIADEIGSRVQQILHVHEIVYDGTSPRRVPLSRHLRVVVADVFRKHGVSRLTYSVDALPVETGAQTAIRVLLILEEVALNALRHAFPDGRRGHLVVGLGEAGKGKYELRIADNGIGMRRDVDVRKPRTPGLRFVASLVKSVKGSVTYKQDGGTVVTVTFPAE